MNDNLFKKFNNVVSKDHLDLLQETLMSQYFGWYFHPDINHGLVDTDPTRVGFVHTLIRKGNYLSDFSALFEPVALIAADKTKETLIELCRVKANMTLNMNGSEKGIPHQDLELELQPEWNRWSAIFYPFDVDGDTVFYANDKITEIARVTPKKNTMILFDSMTFHHGFLPKIATNRKIVNITFATEPR